MKKVSQSNPKKLLLPLVIAVVVQFLLLGVVVVQQVRLNNRLEALSAEVLQQGYIQGASAGASSTHVAVSVPEDAVYIPELRLKLPLNEQTLKLTYSIRSLEQSNTASASEADISTPALEAFLPPKPQAIGCSTAVRIKIEDKANPYNPHEIVKPSVTLADGRTLQIYSFHHNDCKLAFQVSGVDADAVAAEFAGAKSY